MEKEHVKNRQATEQLLLEAVNRLGEQLLRIPERLDRRLYPAIRFLDQRPPGATGARTTGGFYQGAVPAANRRTTEQLYPAAPLPLGTIDRQRTGGRVA